MDPLPLLTCITCNVGFHESELQRSHYKTDWHRYNLKRKVIQLAPVTQEDFAQRVQLQEQQTSRSGGGDGEQGNPAYCFTCKKSFGNDKAFQNHLFSKRHIQMDGSSQNLETTAPTRKAPAAPKTVDQETLLLAEATKRKEKGSGDEGTSKTPAARKSIFDDDEEDDDEDSWEEVEGAPIPTNQCLFCEHMSEDMDANLEHMSKEHSFFIPDAEYCLNVEGLLEYLGEKVGEGLVCLWCNERGKSFYTLQSVQQHMRDKGHCKILHEEDTVFEFTDFYDYSSSYPDGADVNADEQYVPELVHFNENLQLVLPSGITLGHRSLKIYYKQYVRPSSQLVPKSTKRHNLLSRYKAIGYGSTSLAEAQRKHKDQQFFKKVRDKYQLRLGMNGNKTKQMHYRAQVLV